MKLLISIFFIFMSSMLYAQYEVGMMSADALPEFDVYTKFNGDKVLSIRFQNYKHKMYGLRLSLDQDPYSEYLSFDLHDGQYLDRHGYEGETFEIAIESKSLKNFLIRENQEVNLTNVLRKYYSKGLLRNKDGVTLSVDSIDKIKIKTVNKTIHVKGSHESWFDRISMLEKNDHHTVSKWLYKKIVGNKYDYFDLEQVLNHSFPEILFSQETIYKILQSSNQKELQRHLINCNSFFIL